MKRIFNIETCPPMMERSGRHGLISISSSLRFNKKAVEVLGLKAGATVSFEYEDEQFYLKLDPLGFPLRQGQNGGLRMCNKGLIYQMRLTKGSGSFHFKVGEYDADQDRWLLDTYSSNRKKTK